VVCSDDRSALEIRLGCGELIVSGGVYVLVSGSNIAHDSGHTRVQLGLSAKIRSAPADIRRQLLILLVADVESR
jgi:hypothetical protein